MTRSTPLPDILKRIFPALMACGAALFCALPATSAATPDKVLVVAPNTPGDIGTIQAAINAIPVNSKTPVTILIKPGIYHERLNIPANLPPVTLVGGNPSNTIVEYSLIAYDKGADGKPIGMWNTATAWVKENDFSAINITFANYGGQGGKGYTRMNGQALAMRLDGTHDVFDHCRFQSWQDTLLVNTGRDYFENCTITGSTDYIFGAGTAFFNRCRICSLGHGYITAAKTPRKQRFGFVFNRCRITTFTAPDRVYLGRPWGLYANVIFKHTSMSNGINPRGWIVWDRNQQDVKTTRYAEYDNTGPGAMPQSRVPWLRPLSASAANRLTPRYVLSGKKKWNPESVVQRHLIPQFLTLCHPRFPKRRFNITSFGAISGGKKMNTAAIQHAINACAAAGGGEVVIPKGRFPTGPITLKSNINLHLSRGAVLLMSNTFSDYPIFHHRYQNCITAIHCDNIAITGHGIINGRGAPWWNVYKKSKPGGAPSLAADKLPHRPYLVLLDHCRHVLVRNITLLNSPMCNLVTGDCDDVVVEGITVKAPIHSPNTDGMDPSGRNYLIKGCTFDEGDDCIAIKAGGRPHLLHPASENYLVENCHFFHGHGMSVGSGTDGGLTNLTVRNCSFNGTQAGIRLKADIHNGGLVNDLSYSHLTMKNVDIPILVSSYYNNTSPWAYTIPQRALTGGASPVTAKTPRWRHVDIRDITATGAATAAFIVGRPEMPISNFYMRHVRIAAKAGMHIVNARVVMNRCVITAQTGPAVLTYHAKVTVAK
jgi:pectin methylesterase-like acyl-CoA thioesterase